MHQQNHIDINDPKVQKRLRTKYNLIRELVETEETFNLDLSVISDVYANTLTKPPYLHYASAPDVRALFSNVKQVLVLSRRFVSHLKECVPAYILYECEPKDGEILKDVRSYIGEVILEYIPNLEAVYRVYCKQSQFQLNTFYRLDTLGPPMIQTWLHDCRELSKDFTQAWTLDALLIKPVQRLMKYHLLITSMLEATTADHPDYPALKKGLDKMQEAANKINALEPVNMYVYQKKMDSLYDEDDSYKDDGTILTKVDYNTAMSRLKDYPRIDEELEVLIVQFDRKHRHVKNLMKYLRENIEQIQNHFDANSSFAHAWSTWGADDNKRSKVYKKFALFSLPFTTSSSASVSTNKLLDQIEDNVLSPLQKMYEYYHQASNTILLHDRTHAAYQRYTEWRVVAEGSHDQPELPAEVLADADAFMLSHNLLKIELPELFSSTERVIDASLVRFISIQRDWFRIAVDSTSNVFGLTLDDIRTTTSDPIVSTFERHQSRAARAVVDEKLRICHTLESTGTGFDAVTLVESSQQTHHSSHHIQPQNSHLSQHKEYQVQQQAQQLQYAQQIPRQHTLTTAKSLQLTSVSSPSSLSSASQDSESINSATTPTTPQQKRRSMILNWPIRKNTLRK